MESLKGVKVAILVTDGFEQDELLQPRKALDQQGAETEVVSPNDQNVHAWKLKDWGETVKVDRKLSEAKASEFDALLLPGGVMNPDKLRMDAKSVEFVRSFFDSGKPVAAICHGPWSIIEAGAARGRKIASWPSLKTDLRNAGAEWIDKEAVVDGNLVSARKPDDMPAFNRAMIEIFSRAHGRAGHASGAAEPEHQRGQGEGQQNVQHHTRHIKQLLSAAANHAREDVHKVSEPKAQALFETTAETLNGLVKAFDDFEHKTEAAWKKGAGSR